MKMRATYAKGALFLREAIPLPENTDVEIDVKIEDKLNVSQEGMEKIYEILNMRFDDPNSPGDLAERHNEHQP